MLSPGNSALITAPPGIRKWVAANLSDRQHGTSHLSLFLVHPWIILQLDNGPLASPEGTNQEKALTARIGCKSKASGAVLLPWRVVACTLTYIEIGTTLEQKEPGHGKSIGRLLQHVR